MKIHKLEIVWDKTEAILFNGRRHKDNEHWHKKIKKLSIYWLSLTPKHYCCYSRGRSMTRGHKNRDRNMLQQNYEDCCCISNCSGRSNPYIQMDEMSTQAREKFLIRQGLFRVYTKRIGKKRRVTTARIVGK